MSSTTTTPAVRHVPRWLSLPPLVAIAVLLVYPTVFVVAASFTRTTLARPLQEWTGFANLTSALQTEAFAGSLVRTVVFAVGERAPGMTAEKFGFASTNCRGGGAQVRAMILRQCGDDGVR